MAKPDQRENPAAQAFNQGLARLQAHPIFQGLCQRLQFLRSVPSQCPPDGWVQAHLQNGYNKPVLHIHPKRMATAEEWSYCLGRAVLDVFEQEPLPADSPLWGQPNLIITPHNSAYSFPDDVAQIFVRNYIRFIDGQPLDGKIDFDKGY